MGLQLVITIFLAILCIVALPLLTVFVLQLAEIKSMKIKGHKKHNNTANLKE